MHRQYLPRQHKTISLILLSLATFSVLLFIASLYHRIVSTDDAWFAEQAYWFARDGYVHSNLFEGFPIFAHEILVYHKLHIWTGALVYKLFGWSAYYFKAIALPYLIIFLILVFRFLKHVAPIENRLHIFIYFVFLFSVNHLVFQEGFEYRPEIPMMCIGFISYLSIRRAELTKNNLFAILSGVMAGLAALYHLNGLIFIAAGGLLLLCNKNYKLSFWFGLGAIIGFLPYFYHLTSLERLHHYLYDLTHDPAVSQEDRTLSGMLRKLFTEYQRFTHHVYEFTYLLIFLISIIGNWRRIMANPEHRNLLLYTIFLTIFMALITTGSKTSYLLYSMPYVLILVSIYFTRILDRKRIAPVFLTVMAIYFLSNLDRDHGVFVDQTHHSPALYAEIVNKYKIPPGSAIFAPIGFIFNEIGNLKIQCYLAYLAKYRNDMSKITVDNVLGDVYRRQKAFAIMNPTMLHDLNFMPKLGKSYAGYEYLGKESDLYIFKRIPPNTANIKHQ